MPTRWLLDRTFAGPNSLSVGGRGRLRGENSIRLASVQASFQSCRGGPIERRLVAAPVGSRMVARGPPPPASEMPSFFAHCRRLRPPERRTAACAAHVGVACPTEETAVVVCLSWSLWCPPSRLGRWESGGALGSSAAFDSDAQLGGGRRARPWGKLATSAIGPSAHARTGRSHWGVREVRASVVRVCLLCGAGWTRGGVDAQPAAAVGESQFKSHTPPAPPPQEAGGRVAFNP